MQLCAMVQLSFLTCVFLRCLCCCYSFLFFSVVCLSAVLWFCWQTFVVMVFSGLTVLFYNVHCTRCRSSVLLFTLCTVTLIWRHSLPLICESRPVTSALFGISGSVVPTYCEGSLSTLPPYRIPYYYQYTFVQHE